MTTGTTRTPRNHARRVEDLQDLQRRGLIRFLNSTPPADGRRWTYTVEVLGERMDIPTRHVDSWLAGFRQAVAVINHVGMNGARQIRTLEDTLGDTPTTKRRTRA